MPAYKDIDGSRDLHFFNQPLKVKQSFAIYVSFTLEREMKILLFD